MDRFIAMLILLGTLVSTILMILALFAMAPILCSCILSLIYSLYLFMAYEESGLHHAQEFENRFWTIFALLLSTALFFAKDSPLAFGRTSPSLGFVGVVLSSYAMHLWDRHTHRMALSQQTILRRSPSFPHGSGEIDVPVEKQLAKISNCLRDIDQLLIPSTINNFINERFVLRKEREIISVFLDADAVALNHLVQRSKIGLVIYKIKDHRNFAGQHRTQLIQILAVDRLPALTVISRVIVLHALQMLKLRANPRAEYWVRNIFLNTHGDDLSDMKTLTDAKGDYFCMNKLIFDDIRSETVRQDILKHIRKEAAVQEAHIQMQTKRAKKREHMAWRKVLSDVDDTLISSGGHYPAGIDKRFMKKVLYPGVLAFYRELDLGTRGPEEWPENRIGNLVFLSARPHLYRDLTEKGNFAKFKKLRFLGSDGRIGMHTVPSLLAGDIQSGSQFIATNDCEPLARKKFSNFERYVAIYPEYKHIFVCDNGQGDVRASEMMNDQFPYEFEAAYVHVVQEVSKTYGYNLQRWKEKEFKPCFFRTYPEAALDAASRKPPLIRISGLRRVCVDAVKDFHLIQPRQWASLRQKAERRAEINQGIWRANQFLESNGVEPVEMIQAEQVWRNGELVNTPYGRGTIQGFDPSLDLYDVELDWRPLNIQLEEHIQRVKQETEPGRTHPPGEEVDILETVIEQDESSVDEDSESASRPAAAPLLSPKEAAVSKDKTSIKKASPSEDRTKYPVIRSKIRGNVITKFSPPTLPSVSKKSSLFSFWTAVPESKESHTFKVGDKCTTPYGPGTVAGYRPRDKVIEVTMVGWKAKAYLNEASVQIVSQGIFSTLFRRQGSLVTSHDSPKKQLSFPYAQGTIIKTPYGEASVVRPLPLPSSPDKMTSKSAHVDSSKTIGLSLTSWSLSDENHPVLYCTVEQARQWKEARVHDKPPSDGILSTIGTLVTSTLDFAGMLGTTTGTGKGEKDKESSPIEPKFKQYFKDAAAVSTELGDGVVRRFRESDGFYEIALVKWKLSGGKHPMAYLRQNQVSHRIAAGCHEGYPVLTYLGLTGVLESVEPTTGCHLVVVQSGNIVMYLQPEAILKPLKAAVGDAVVMKYFQEGTVTHYNQVTDMYTIRLSGWNATMYAKAENFDRVGDSMRDRDGSQGINWFMRFFFASPSSQNTTLTRSRSNSITSVRSQSVISATAV